MDIAVKYEKINLGNERYVFKPVCIIKGKYDPEVDTFETEYKDLCANIEGDSQFEDNYFGCHITLDDLKKVYADQGLTEEEMFMLYYEECTSAFCIGQFDYVEHRMQIISIPFEDFDSVFEAEDEEYIPTENGVQIKFKLEELKKLREINDIEEIREKLDAVILCAKTIDDNNKTFNESVRVNKEKELNEVFALQKETSKLISLKELRKEVKDVIKAQDKAVDAVTRGIIVNQMSNNPRHKSHILITGPSGTGKTDMINIISKKLGIPYFKVDSPQYTSEGYVGKSVYSMLSGLLTAANNDLNKAEHGILIVDEIDKKLTEGVNGKEVLNAMLKMMDREIVEVDIGHGYQERKVMFDTANLTIIFMGAFADLYASKEKDKKRGIGFNTTTEKEEKKEKISITNEDLIKAGMPPEFLGRIPIVTSTEELEVEDLVEILYKSKGGAIDEEKEFFKDLGITVKFTGPYMREIAEKAHKTKTGARNLRKLVRESLAVAYDDILSGKKVKVLKITKETANDPTKYYTE